MGKRQAIKERRLKRQRQQRVTTILVVSGAALILAALLMLPTVRGALTPVGEYNKPALKSRPMVDGNTMGDPNAPVKFVEYSDFGCSHCKNFAEGTEDRIVEEYVTTGEVFVEYRSVGGLLGSQITPLAAEAAYCAGDQGEFWAYHDYLFANQITLFVNPQGNFEKYFQTFAEDLGLDVDEFNQCYDSHKYSERVQQDELDARQADISSTPSFLINDQLVVGNLPLESFQQTIETKLAEAGY